MAQRHPAFKTRDVVAMLKSGPCAIPVYASPSDMEFRLIPDTDTQDNHEAMGAVAAWCLRTRCLLAAMLTPVQQAWLLGRRRPRAFACDEDWTLWAEDLCRRLDARGFISLLFDERSLS